MESHQQIMQFLSLKVFQDKLNSPWNILLEVAVRFDLALMNQLTWCHLGIKVRLEIHHIHSVSQLQVSALPKWPTPVCTHKAELLPTRINSTWELKIAVLPGLNKRPITPVFEKWRVAFLLNHRIIGWKRPLRSSSPTIHPAPPCLLNHVLKCHIYTFLEHLQGW